MDQNGFNNNNYFQGPVFIEGNTDIDGNLDVTGTINGGSGSGSVNNPMTEDLDANQFSIHNVSEITGFEGVLRTNQLDLQDNDIININEIKGNSENKLYISANVEMSENLDMTDKSIININELKCSTGSEIKTSLLNLQNNNIIGVNSIHLNLLEGLSNSIAIYGETKIIGSLNLHGYPINNVANLTAHVINGPNLNLDLIPLTTGTVNQVLARDPNYNPSNPSTHKLVWQTIPTGTVTNPLSSNLNCNSLNLNNCFTINTNNISSNSGTTSVNSILVHTSNVNMNNNSIYNIGGTTTSYNGVDLKLDLCPATQGLPSYMLTRDPAFNPADPNTHKLVWRQPSTSGVNNPMTEALNANNNNITSLNSLDTKIITNTSTNIVTIATSVLFINNGVNLAPTSIEITGKLLFTNAYATVENVGGLIIDISQIKNNGSTILVADLTDFTQGIKTNTIVPRSGTQITHSAPQINFFNSASADTSVYINGGIQFNNHFTIPEIRGDNLFLRGQTALGVATPLNLVGTVLSLGSSISTELVGTVNCQNRLNNLFNDSKMGTRNVRTSLYKIYGNNSIILSFNTVIPVQIDVTNGPTIGLPVLKAGSMRSGDKLNIRLNTALTTSAAGNMEVYVYMGTSLINKKLQTVFSLPNVSTSNTLSSFIFELDCIVTGTTMFFDDTALLTVNRSNLTSRIIPGTATAVGQEVFTTNDNFIYIFAGVSIVINGASISVHGETIEHY